MLIRLAHSKTFVLPPDVQQAPKAAEVESVESALLSGIGCPQLAAVKES